MPSNPFDHPPIDPDPRDPHRKLVVYLLSQSEAEADDVAGKCDAIVRKKGRVAELLARHQASFEDVYGERILATIADELSDIDKLARSAGRHSAKASGYTDQALEKFQIPESFGADGADLASALGPEVQSLVLKHTIRNPEGKISKYVFLIDGTRYQFSGALGALLEELSASEGASTDRFVPFKSRNVLQEALGVDSEALHTQVNRLRNKLQEDYAFARELVETDRLRSYRLRLTREVPGQNL